MDGFLGISLQLQREGFHEWKRVLQDWFRDREVKLVDHRQASSSLPHSVFSYNTIVFRHQFSQNGVTVGCETVFCNKEAVQIVLYDEIMDF